METASRYKLVTKADYASVLRDYSRTPMNQSLSRAALETLSIIAYKQPITRVEVDDIRGVNSSGAITKLLSFDLIREDGKKEVPGVLICMSRRSIFGLYGDQSFGGIAKG